MVGRLLDQKNGFSGLKATGVGGMRNSKGGCGGGGGVLGGEDVKVVSLAGDLFVL